MSWIEYHLEEVALISSGFAFKSNEMSIDSGTPVIKIKNINDRKVYKKTDTYIPSKFYNVKYDKYILKEGDILVAMTGQGSVGRIGKMYNVDGEYLINQRVGIIKAKENICNDEFLFQLIATPENEKKYFNLAQGAGQPNLSPKDIGALQISIPKSLEIQKRIASILTTYDDLIENNLKRIKLLEETAQNIYKEWFVNFRFPNYEHTEFDSESGLPVGWEVDIIGNQLLTIKRNGKLKTDDYELEGKFPIIDQANGFIAGYTNNEEVVQDLHLPIVVFGDHTRRVKFVNFPFVSGADGTQLMFPKNENLLPAYFYLSINNIDLSNYAYARHYKFMKEQPIIIPDEKTLDEFNKKAYPLLEQTIHLLNYNQKLKEARDILLPRLMNRTIDV
jgi:type I restriction enzyme S subunit